MSWTAQPRGAGGAGKDPSSGAHVENLAIGRQSWTLAVVLSLCGCATPGPPGAFQLESNRPLQDAFDCALTVLERNGFLVEQPPPDSAEASASPSTARTALALRPPSSAAPLGEREWWRIELSVASGGRIPSVLTGVTGVSRRREGPYQKAGPLIEHVLGEVSARCTWGTSSG